MVKKGSKIIQKKIKRKLSKGIIYIKSNFNNTIITLTNLKGDAIAWASSLIKNLNTQILALKPVNNTPPC